MARLDYSKLRAVTVRDIMRALERDDFRLIRVAGSHYRYRHLDGRRVTVSFYRASDTFAPKTLKSIIELQFQWTELDLRRLKLIK